MRRHIFLSAKWEYLAMINYEVDPEILKPYLPPFTEIDFFNGKALVSIVGFLFNATKVLGIKWPFLTNFEEVNLRFYIKHFDGIKWKRGVSFVSEIVPSSIIANTANFLYNEHYIKAKMFHNIRELNNKLIVEYNWKLKNQKWNSIEINTATTLMDIKPESEEEFIFEHYYGYNKLTNFTSVEYAVEHPKWQTFAVCDYFLKCDIGKLYGSTFVPFIEGKKPHSVFLAKGSEVSVGKPLKILDKSSAGKIITGKSVTK